MGKREGQSKGAVPRPLACVFLGGENVSRQGGLSVNSGEHCHRLNVPLRTPFDAHIFPHRRMHITVKAAPATHHTRPQIVDAKAPRRAGTHGVDRLSQVQTRLLGVHEPFADTCDGPNDGL